MTFNRYIHFILICSMIFLLCISPLACHASSFYTYVSKPSIIDHDGVHSSLTYAGATNIYPGSSGETFPDNGVNGYHYFYCNALTYTEYISNQGFSYIDIDLEFETLDLPVGSDVLYGFEFDFALCSIKVANTSVTQSVVGMPSNITGQLISSFGESTISFNESNNIATGRGYAQIPSDGGTFRIHVTVGFGDNSDMIWSSANAVMFSNVTFSRSADSNDVVDSITQSTQDILNADGNGSIHNVNSNISSSSDNLHSSETELMDSVGNTVHFQSIDNELSFFGNTLGFVRSCIDGIIDAYGGGFNRLFSVLSILGVVGSLFGLTLSAIAKKTKE